MQNARACPDCGEDVSLTRSASNAVYCRPCADERRRATFREHDRKRTESRKAYLRTEAARERNREAVKRYRMTKKGQEAAARAESKPRRKAYQREWNRKHKDERPVFFYCPEDWSFDRWIDKILAEPPPRLPILHLKVSYWQPFTVPDYLKTKTPA